MAELKKLPIGIEDFYTAKTLWSRKEKVNQI